jgi:hypothetical protein
VCSISTISRTVSVSMDCIYAWVVYACLIMKVTCYVFDLILTNSISCGSV